MADYAQKCADVTGLGPGQQVPSQAAPAASAELPAAFAGLPAAFAGAGAASAASRLPAAFAAAGGKAAPAPAVGVPAVQSAGGSAVAPAADGGLAATWAGGGSAQPGAAAYAQLPDGAAMYAQHVEYTRYIAALQMQHAAAGSLGGAASPPLSSSVMQATRGGAWLGLKNHDPDRRYQGVVCRWDEQAGFGFINDLDSHRVYGRDVFLHAAQIDREADNYKRRRKIDIANGDRVMFMVEMDRGKPRARDVEIVERCGKRDDPPDRGEPEGKRRRE